MKETLILIGYGVRADHDGKYHSEDDDTITLGRRSVPALLNRGLIKVQATTLLYGLLGACIELTPQGQEVFEKLRGV